MEKSREARRKRIVERGTDRLAFITGQRPTIPQFQQSAADDDDENESQAIALGSVLPGTRAESKEADLVPANHEKKPDYMNQSDQDAEVHKYIPAVQQPSRPLHTNLNSKADIKEEMHEVISATHQPHQAISDPDVPPAHARPLRTNEDNLLSSSEEPSSLHSSAKTLGRSIATDVVQPLVPPTQVTPAQVSDTKPKARPHQDSVAVTLNNLLTSSISTTENIRIFVVLVIGLLVLFTFNTPSFLGGILRPISQFPLVSVLFGDIFVVLGPMLANASQFKNIKEKKVGGTEMGWANQLGNGIEVALVLKKVLSALFMDCAICSVVMICGLSLGGYY